MRIAHATDIHWTESVPFTKLFGKRTLGTANQILRGRRHHFPEDVQQALMDHVRSLSPDLFVVTGDLTAQALPSEFDKARRFLAPVMQQIDTLVLAGNHDVYTRGARDTDRIASYFGDQLHRAGPIQRLDRNGLVVLGLDPNRPTFLDAAGEVPTEQLDALSEALEDPTLDGRFRILALHYPLLDRRGDVYDNTHHGLLNARVLIERLRAATYKPHLCIHGHEHHGFSVPLDLGGHTMVIANSGSSGYRFMPEKRRAAAMNVYVVEGESFEVERYMYDGTAFVPEDGGAYATGR